MPLSRKRTWLLRIVAALIVLVPAAIVTTGYVADNFGSKRLKRALEALDRYEPGWQLAEMRANCEAGLPPDAENPMVQTTTVVALLGNVDLSRRRYQLNPNGQPINALPPAAELAAKRGLTIQRPEAVKAALKLAEFHRDGGQPSRVPMEPFLTVKPMHACRTVQDLLRLEVEQALVERRDSDASKANSAMLNLARGTDPMQSLFGTLVRLMLVGEAAATTERLLALSETDAGLAELQDGYLREGNRPDWAAIMRTERARFQFEMEAYERGDTSASAVFGWGQTTKPEGIAKEWMVRRNLHDDWVFGLECCNRSIAAAEMPFGQRLSALRRIEEHAATVPACRFTNHFLASISHRGLELMVLRSVRLHACAVGIACERHRQKFGRWPTALADIPKDILPAIPLDPFTGKPLHYGHLPDGVTVYGIGPDGIDHGGPANDIPVYDEQARDWGIKLYHPELRRKPAPPTPPGDTVVQPAPVPPKP